MAKLLVLGKLVKMMLGWTVGLVVAITPMAVAKSPSIEALDPLNGYIDKLATCESRQIPDVVIVDTNGKLSYGWLQFQQDTFDEFGKRYGLPHDDILSPAQQIPIAKEMIRNGLWERWKNCGLKIGLDKLG